MKTGCCLCVLTLGCGVACLFFSFKTKLIAAYKQSFADEGFDITYNVGGGEGDRASVIVHGFSPVAPASVEMARP